MRAPVKLRARLEPAAITQPDDTGRMETPSGKWAGDENFPVASKLIARPLRPHVMAYYAFARAIDDIADHPELSPDDKVARLDAFGRALTDPEADDPALATAHRLRQSLTATGVPAQHGLDLVTAFKQDAVKGRYDGWDDLLGYCRYSASPVGRFLLDLHGEDRALWPYSDALCDLLQVLNHLQDCQTDYLTLDRVYLPEPWLAEQGEAVTALARDHASAGVRRVIDRCLDGVETLLPRAEALPRHLADARLALESAAIVALARALTGRLRRQDPLAVRVELGKPMKLAVAARGALGTLLARRFAPASTPDRPREEPRA
ncbi:squalene synthase HpnC [Limimonas halophila]|uniref:Squalene synthase HpnC n=2 Tax=Limimonas halophila TaxID=1082479 RepID=A0A1G7UYS8_9PROT|nr:squalene synthase HpnC [Limimonas halophila]